MAKQHPRSIADPVANIVAAALAFALALTPRLVAPCSHQITTAGGGSVPMRCHWTFQAEALVAVAAVVVAGALWIVRHAEARRVTGTGLILVGFLAVAVTRPWAIGLCGNAEMACHRTAHWIWLWAVLLAGTGMLIAIRARVPDESGAEADPWDSPKTKSEGARS